jgi:hypothetical protein
MLLCKRLSKNIAIGLMAAGLVAASAFPASSIRISQQLSDSSIPFADSVLLTIELSWDGPQHAYLFPKPVTPILDRLKVGGFRSSISSQGSGESEVTTKLYQFSLLPTISGAGIISSAQIEYMSWPDSTTGFLQTEPLTVQIADPVAIDIPNDSPLPLWIGFVGLLIGAGAIFGVTFFIRRRKPVEKPLTPADRALTQLIQVKEKAGSDFKLFQTGLLDLLTRFVEDLFAVQIENASDDEVLLRLKETPLSEADVERLTKWIVGARRDKFAPVNTEPGALVRLEVEVRQFLERLQ